METKGKIIMSETMEHAIENLATLAPCQPTEIRITIRGGAIQEIQKGKDIPHDIIVTVSD